MKITLIALNASYTHTSLGCAYLKSYCQDPRWCMDIMEFTVNDYYGSILSRLIAAQSDIYGFSCYIWNIELVLRLCRDLKLIRPHSFIVVGGPEVSYNAEEIMRKHPQLDAVICGEGEVTMYDLLQALDRGQASKEIPGLIRRHQNDLIIGTPRLPLKDLDTIPSPVPFMNTEGRLVYYETSRGCPFSCSYCLSACETGVRFFSLERVKSDLKALMKSGAKVIKFVDRSFSINEKRARQIMEFILAHHTSTRFHFEINAELLSDEMLGFLTTVPQGIFDFEIGIQSTYPPTLEAIHRHTDWFRLRERILRLRKARNIHLHVDLIAGLPHESYQQFANSFDEVYHLQADVIQLGFLTTVPPGIFDFEIGIQSTYPPTLKAIHRNTDWFRLRERILRLQKARNIHLHVDLIAGLPYESYQQFANSFNEVYHLQADVIQLGFLKMLKGSPLGDQADYYQYVFQPHPHYEVVGNNVITFDELGQLHLIDDKLGRFYNSHHFEKSIKHL